MHIVLATSCTSLKDGYQKELLLCVTIQSLFEMHVVGDCHETEVNIYVKSVFLDSPYYLGSNNMFGINFKVWKIHPS